MTKLRRVALAPFANGTELALTIHEVKGKQGDGPTLGISAAIHGDEPTGTHTVMEIARRYGEGGFRGRLLLLPVANPLAFEANRRCTPLDSKKRSTTSSSTMPRNCRAVSARLSCSGPMTIRRDRRSRPPPSR